MEIEQRERVGREVEHDPVRLEETADAGVLPASDRGHGADDHVTAADTEAVDNRDGRVEVERRFLGAVGVQLEEPHIAFMIGSCR